MLKHAGLHLKTLAAVPICPADFNGSGMVSVQTNFDVLEASFAGYP